MEPPTETPAVPPPPAAPDRRWPAAWAIAAIALALRVAWALIVPVEPVSDSYVYDLFARNIAAGHGYCFVPGTPTAYWPVGTAALYAPIYKVFGPGSYTAVALLNALIGTATVVLTMRLTRDWFGPRAGLAAGIILAAWPGQIQFTSVIASELPFNLCWVAALYAATRAGPHPALRVVLSGVALAGACYVRPVALLLPLVFAWIRLLGPGGPPLASRRAALVLAESAGTLAVMMALILPWTLRNAQAFGRPILVSTNGGANLWMGNNPETQGGYMPLPDSVEGLDEATRDRLLKDQAVQYIKDRPAAFVVRSLVKLVRSHDRENIGVVWNGPGLERAVGPSVIMPLKLLSTGYWYAVLLLALPGAVAALRGSGPWRWVGHPPLALLAYFTALHAIIVAGDRYHYPSVPALAALAGCGAVALIGLRKPPDPGASPSPSPPSSPGPPGPSAITS